MRSGNWLAAAVIAGMSCELWAAEPVSLRAVRGEHEVRIYAGESLFTTYQFAPTQKYPYFWPVNGPLTGQSVTTESSEPYPHHHSLFFGCDRVNGGNYWQEGNERGQILSQEIELLVDSGEKVEFSDDCVWQQPGQAPVLRDARRISISAPSTLLRLIDFDITLEALTPVRIEKTNHSLFSARVVPELSVQAGGTLVNAEGKRGEPETFGVPSPWCDYSGTRDGKVEGLAIFQHPANRWYPAPWFTRDYGFFSPTPMYWLEGDHLDLEQGERLRLRYRVVVHGGALEHEEIATLFREYAAMP